MIYESAHVDKGAVIGHGTRIWHGAHVCAGAQIGEDCVIGQNCYIASVVISNGCKIQNNVSVYDGVHLEESVFVGPSAVFTNTRTPRAFINSKSKYLSTIVRIGASIGANATILCGVEIGQYAMIGAGAVVTRSVPSFQLWFGNPARWRGNVDQGGNVINHWKAKK